MVCLVHKAKDQHTHRTNPPSTTVRSITRTSIEPSLRMYCSETSGSLDASVLSCNGSSPVPRCVRLHKNIHHVLHPIGLSASPRGWKAHGSVRVLA